ncbi:MAG: hypothetical protein A49_08540 [Methyloceanibacter sp.]|nr:MAG: hypothetical protein A49_08540 [Methyloceanibacter sp.]
MGVSVRIVRRKHKDLKRPDMSGPSKVKVGFPAGATGGDILNRAVWNHFGTRGGASGGGWGGPIPERPFLANAIRDNTGTYKAALKTSAARILLGEASMQLVLSKLGELAKGHTQREITSLSSPPNSPVTIALKGSSNPLVDSGEMRGSVTWKIDDA